MHLHFMLPGERRLFLANRLTIASIPCDGKYIAGAVIVDPFAAGSLVHAPPVVRCHLVVF